MGGFYVFNSIVCKRGVPAAAPARARASVVDGARGNPKASLPTSGEEGAPAGSDAVAQ